MKDLTICKSPVELNLKNYQLAGGPIINQTRKLKDLKGIFQDFRMGIFPFTSLPLPLAS